MRPCASVFIAVNDTRTIYTNVIRIINDEFFIHIPSIVAEQTLAIHFGNKIEITTQTTRIISFYVLHFLLGSATNEYMYGFSLMLRRRRFDS